LKFVFLIFLDQDKLLVGDCLVSAAFLSYMGPFLSQYREEMLALWLEEIDKDQIPRTPTYKVSSMTGQTISTINIDIQ
jgi:uncharacterized membrane protein